MILKTLTSELGKVVQVQAVFPPPPRLIRFKGHPPYHTKTIQCKVKLCTLRIMTCTTRSKFKVTIILREFVLHN